MLCYGCGDDDGGSADAGPPDAFVAPIGSCDDAPVVIAALAGESAIGRVVSLAAGADGRWAVTYESATRGDATFLRVFEPTGVPLDSPRTTAPRARIQALGDGYVLAEPTFDGPSFALLDASGAELERTPLARADGWVTRLVTERDDVIAIVRDASSERVVRVSSSGDSITVDEELSLPLVDRRVFGVGPDVLLELVPPDFSAPETTNTLAVGRARNEDGTWTETFRIASWDEDGVRDVAAAAWSADGAWRVLGGELQAPIEDGFVRAWLATLSADGASEPRVGIEDDGEPIIGYGVDGAFVPTDDALAIVVYAGDGSPVGPEGVHLGVYEGDAKLEVTRIVVDNPEGMPALAWNAATERIGLAGRPGSLFAGGPNLVLRCDVEADGSFDDPSSYAEWVPPPLPTTPTGACGPDRAEVVDPDLTDALPSGFTTDRWVALPDHLAFCGAHDHGDHSAEAIVVFVSRDGVVTHTESLGNVSTDDGEEILCARLGDGLLVGLDGALTLYAPDGSERASLAGNAAILLASYGSGVVSFTEGAAFDVRFDGTTLEMTRIDGLDGALPRSGIAGGEHVAARDEAGWLAVEREADGTWVDASAPAADAAVAAWDDIDGAFWTFAEEPLAGTPYSRVVARGANGTAEPTPLEAPLGTAHYVELLARRDGAGATRALLVGTSSESSVRFDTVTVDVDGDRTTWQATFATLWPNDDEEAFDVPFAVPVDPTGASRARPLYRRCGFE